MKNRAAYFGVFTALALIFSYVETCIPISFGIPGVKLGLANLMIVIMLYKGCLLYTSNPKKVFQVGDTLKVLVKDIHDTKIALSLKFPETNPWAHASENFAVGTVINGKVARMTDFGAFIELAPGVDALLHVSQISRAHVEKPSDVLSIGQEITAKIVDLNEAEKKISLSMKVLEAEAVPSDESEE